MSYLAALLEKVAQNSLGNLVVKRGTIANGSGVLYTANDIVGGVIQFENIVARAGDPVVLHIGSAVDRGKTGMTMRLVMFDEAPTGIPADNEPLEIGVGDRTKFIAIAGALFGATIIQTATVGLHQSNPLSNFYMPTKSRHLWGVFIASVVGTPSAPSVYDYMLTFASPKG